MYYTIIETNGYVDGTASAETPFASNITEEKKNELFRIICNKPSAPSGYTYKLRADTLVWELVELPPEPTEDLTLEEALAILLGGDGA